MSPLSLPRNLLYIPAPENRGKLCFVWRCGKKRAREKPLRRKSIKVFFWGYFSSFYMLSEQHWLSPSTLLISSPPASFSLPTHCSSGCWSNFAYSLRCSNRKCYRDGERNSQSSDSVLIKIFWASIASAMNCFSFIIKTSTILSILNKISCFNWRAVKFNSTEGQCQKYENNWT